MVVWKSYSHHAKKPKTTGKCCLPGCFTLIYHVSILTFANLLYTSGIFRKSLYDLIRMRDKLEGITLVLIPSRCLQVGRSAAVPAGHLLYSDCSKCQHQTPFFPR